MKVVAFNGSPRKRGNTWQMLRHCLGALERQGITTEIIQVGGTGVRPCMACQKCRKAGVMSCSIQDDGLNDWLRAMIEADGIILGSPTFCFAPTPEMKCLLDRIGYIIHQRCNLGEINPLRRKVGASVAVDGNDGSIQTVEAMNRLFIFSQMFIAGASYWPVCLGFKPGAALEDERGMKALEDVAANMAWFLENTTHGSV